MFYPQINQTDCCTWLIYKRQWTTVTNGRPRNATISQIWKSTNESRWQLQDTSLQEREVRNFRPGDSGWTERKSKTKPSTTSKLIHRYKLCCTEGQCSWSTSVAVPLISLQAGRASVPDSCPSPRRDVRNATPSLIKRNACCPLASGLTNGKNHLISLCDDELSALNTHSPLSSWSARRDCALLNTSRRTLA